MDTTSAHVISDGAGGGLSVGVENNNTVTISSDDVYDIELGDGVYEYNWNSWAVGDLTTRVHYVQQKALPYVYWIGLILNALVLLVSSLPHVHYYITNTKIHKINVYI